MEEFQERDSGWALKEVRNLKLTFNPYTVAIAAAYKDLKRIWFYVSVPEFMQ